jgi:hypothetical protein
LRQFAKVLGSEIEIDISLLPKQVEDGLSVQRADIKPWNLP